MFGIKKVFKIQSTKQNTRHLDRCKKFDFKCKWVEVICMLNSNA